MHAEPHRGRIAFCSIATSSHLAAACLALRSFGRHATGAELVLLLASPGDDTRADGIRTLSAQACVPAAALQAMRDRYSPAELCFALKPHLLAALLEQGYDQVHYLDSDCRAYGDLAPLIEDLSAADLLLTPHCLSPIPDDGLTPAALTVLRAGSFNAGYIGARASVAGRAFARWLCAMTERHAYNQPARGMCGDQRWLDLAPALFPGLGICRRRGANVGYWNLHERPLARDVEGSYTAGDEPLLFFHFSGLDPARPQQLSRHQNRHALVVGEPLQMLVQEYLRLPGVASATGELSRLGRSRRAVDGFFRRHRREGDDEPRK